MRKISYKLGIKLITLFFLLMVIIGHVFDTLYVHYYVDHIEEELYYRGESHADVLAEYFNPQTIHHVAMMEREADTAVVVLGPTWEILISSNPIKTDQLKYLRPYKTIRSSKPEIDWRNSPYLVTKSPIVRDGKLLGTVVMFSPTETIQKQVSDIHWAVNILGIGSIIISSFIIIIFSKQITQPLIEIKMMTQQIAKGNYQVQLPVKGEDEITDLTIAINSMACELHRYETTRNEFLSNISHELRTPLMYIKGYADLLSQDRIHNLEERKSYLKIISDETLRVQHLVKDLFDLTKYRERKISLNKEKINLVMFLNEIIKRTRVQMEQKLITCHFTSNQDVVSGSIDPERMAQVITNLLENARTYTSENGKITLRLHAADSTATIKIADNGIGIPEDELPFVWERFYRVEKSRSRNYGGTGLGLPIAKEIVELHEGSIEVASVEGKGTTFTIKLPI